MMSGYVDSQRVFPYCLSVQATISEMDHAIARMANNDSAFDLISFEEGAGRLNYFDMLPIPCKITQCIWFASVSGFLIERYDPQDLADRLAPYTYGDWQQMACSISVPRHDGQCSQGCRSLRIALSSGDSHVQVTIPLIGHLCERQPGNHQWDIVLKTGS